MPLQLQSKPKHFFVSLLFVVLFFLSPFSSKSQIVGGDWCTVTIESVKCVKPSTGQDAYTSFLFKGIEIAIQAAVAMGTGGSSLTATAASTIAKEALKKTAKAGLKIAVTNQAKNFYAANKDEIMGLANLKAGGGGESNPAFKQAAGAAMEVYQLTSLQGIFNKVYGESPDDLYIKVNGNKVWPSGKSVSIKSQQALTVGYSFDIQKAKPFSIQLVEYDYASADDDMGSLTFKIPDNLTGTDWIRDQVYHHEGEGSVYMITLRVESKLKHKFINDLPYSGWDIKVNDAPSGVLVFEETTLDFLDMTHPGWKGFTWGIHTIDKIKFYNPGNGSQYYVTFNSENSFSGLSMVDNKSTITGTRRASMHRYINNLVGSSWKQTNVTGDVIYTYKADGTMEINNGVKGFNWHVTGPDKIMQCLYTDCYLALTFTSENNATGQYTTPVATGHPTNYTAERVNASAQNQTVQTQNLQHRFITNIVGTSWDFSDPAGGNISFTFGGENVTNVTPAGTFWDAVTWKVAGNDIIEFRANNGATMNIVFTDQNNFTGYSWYDKTKVATGSIRQAQQQQPLQSSETLPSRYINNITGKTCHFEDPAGGNVVFTFGQGNIINVTPAGTFWDAVTWRPGTRDNIEFRTKEGAVMNIYFSDPVNFTGFSWFNKDVVVAGKVQ